MCNWGTGQMRTRRLRTQKVDGGDAEEPVTLPVIQANGFAHEDL